jgi:serine/threonine protein kinase
LSTGQVPQSIENIITRATAKLPGQRYRSCDEMLRDISTCLRPERLNEKKLVLKVPEVPKKPELVMMEEQNVSPDGEDSQETRSASQREKEEHDE